MNCTADLINALNIKQYPARWDTLYEPAIAEYVKFGGYFADEEYLLQLNNEYRLFERTLDDVLCAAIKLKKKPELIQYILLLNIAMKDQDAFAREIDTLEPPSAPDGEDTAPYDLALLFAILPSIPESAKSMREHGVPEDVYYATFAGYEASMVGFRMRNGRLGIDRGYLSWLQVYINAHILRIGRLNFEMCARFGSNVHVLQNTCGEIQILMTNARIHRDGMVLGVPGYEDEDGAYDANFLETNDYFEGYPVGDDGYVKSQRIRLLKSLWRIVLSTDDPVISVHIPAGEKLSKELCESAYSRAREIFADCYPAFKYKAFVCFSWLMDPQLRKLLPVNSNVISFQSKYTRFPRLCTGKAVLSFVFHNQFDCYENLPENTSLERSLKQHYLSGKYIYEPGGVFF